MNIILSIFQLIFGISLIGLILLQNSKGGLTGGIVPSEGYRTKRGAEKIVFRLTIIVAVLFLIVCILGLLIK